MNRSTTILFALLCIVALALISVVLIVEFHGNDTGVLIAAIFGFTTPTIASLLTLLQSAFNAEKVTEAQTQIADTQKTVESVNKKVDGHLARLTQAVVDSAATGLPVDPNHVTELASQMQRVTGETIKIPKVGP